MKKKQYTIKNKTVSSRSARKLSLPNRSRQFMEPATPIIA